MLTKTVNVFTTWSKHAKHSQNEPGKNTVSLIYHKMGVSDWKSWQNYLAQAPFLHQKPNTESPITFGDVFACTCPYIHRTCMHVSCMNPESYYQPQPCNHNMYQIIIQSHDHDHKPSHWIHRVWHFFNKPLLNRSIRIVHVRLAPFGVTGRRRYMRYPRPCRMTPMNCCFIFLTLEPALPPCLILGDPIFAWSAASAIIRTKPSSWSAPNL